MPKFRKKPVVIDAVKWDGTHISIAELAAFCPGITFHAMMTLKDGKAVYDPLDGQPMARIITLEGEHWAAPGDYIIKGVKGEFYPCKPDIFAATYEAIVN